MKKRLMLICLALLMAAPAMAQIIKTSYYLTPWGPMFTTLDDCRKAGAMPSMPMLDNNRDNRISMREFELSGAPDATVSLFQSIDKNKDGYISKDELDAYRHVGKCNEVR